MATTSEIELREVRWPRWVLIPVALSIVTASVVVVTAIVFVMNARMRDERGLRRAEARVLEVFDGDANLVRAESNYNHSRAKTYRIVGDRITVETALRRQLDAAGLLYQPAQDPPDDSIPLRIGPRYYVELQLSGPTAGPIMVKVFTYIED